MKMHRILDLLHECKTSPHPPTPSPNFGRRGDKFKVPLSSLGEVFRVRAFDSCKKSIKKPAKYAKNRELLI
jgi:hypothetical protein